MHITALRVRHHVHLLDLHAVSPRRCCHGPSSHHRTTFRCFRQHLLHGRVRRLHGDALLPTHLVPGRARPFRLRGGHRSLSAHGVVGSHLDRFGAIGMQMFPVPKPGNADRLQTSRTGYLMPQMIVASILMPIMLGLITRYNIDTSTTYW